MHLLSEKNGGILPVRTRKFKAANRFLSRGKFMYLTEKNHLLSDNSNVQF